MELKNKEINYGRAEFESLPLKLIMQWNLFEYI